MKFRFIYFMALASLITSCFSSLEEYSEDFREGSDSSILINGGSLTGNWEETHRWDDGGGERPSGWSAVNVNYGKSYNFLEDGTFTATNHITYCPEINGTYTVEGTKITLNYFCQELAVKTRADVIEEFFFTKDYIVFIIGANKDRVSRFGLIKE